MFARGNGAKKYCCFSACVVAAIWEKRCVMHVAVIEKLDAANFEQVA
jgi:hypothetical protein